jgi:YesN/AraC family two-component response regulator
MSDFINRANLGFEAVGTFTDGADALGYVRERPVNAVITDIKMPGMSGLELAERLCAGYPQIKIVIVSGYGDFEFAKKAISFNVANYLLKPVDLNELAATLAKIKAALDAEAAPRGGRNADDCTGDGYTADNYTEDEALALLTARIRLGDIRGAKNMLARLSKTNPAAPECAGKFARQAGNDIIGAAKRFIDENYSRNISRDDVAARAFLNPSYLSRYFKQETGVTISEYIMGARIKKALEMLGGNMKIADIGERAGFGNARNFQRLFKAHTGYSPSDFRRRMMKGL